jgi:hypothetical protein
MVSRTKVATFDEFKRFTLSVARGKKIRASEPKIWCERAEGEKGKPAAIRFASLEAGAKLLSTKNRAHCASLPSASRSPSASSPR